MERNLALGALVNAVGGNVTAIVDGDKRTKSYWDGGKAPASATIDLGTLCKIRCVHLVCYHGDERYYHYNIEASANGRDFCVIAVKDNDDLSTAEGDTFECSAEARYVRVNMLYNSANEAVHVCECEVFGEETDTAVETVAAKDDQDPLNIAVGKKCRANSNPGFAYLCTDGADTMYWIGGEYPKYVDVDLEANYKLSLVKVAAPEGAEEDLIIFGSLDGVLFDRIGEGKAGEEIKVKGCYRVVRVLVTRVYPGASSCPMISEIRVHGDLSRKAVEATREKIDFVSHDEWLKAHPEKSVEEELAGLICRTIGKKYEKKFNFVIAASESGKDYFELSGDDPITIKANCGVSAAAGLGYYLENYCGVQITEQTRQVRMPKNLSAVEGKVYIESPFKVRYAYNYCTHGYTTPFFGREEWRKELDWLFLCGINLILDTNGSEALWVHYLQKLGYNADEAKDYVCGYCYKPWWLMGNLEGYGGSVADAWVLDTLELTRECQSYMHVMGAMPCQQTFVGAMPMSFASISNAHLISKGFSDVHPYMAPQGVWGDGFVRPNVLKTNYDGYHYLAKEYYESQRFLFGDVTHYYCGDVCHEGGIIPEGLTKPEMAKTILGELLEVDPEAQWMLQGWWDNPMSEVLDGFGDKRGTNIIILDLASVANPKWNNTEKWGGIEYGGTGWVYCDLNNYGGRTGMHGELQGVADRLDEAKNKANYMRGIGVTPEGSYQNPIVFNFFFESAWGDKKNVPAWVANYQKCRYGADNEHAKKAWELMLDSVYKAGTYDGTSKNNVITENASLAEKYCVGPYYTIKYERKTLEDAAKELTAAFDSLKGEEGYIYDCVDVLRQVLTNASDDYFAAMVKALVERDADTFDNNRVPFIDAMKLISALSSCNRDETMKRWLGRIYEWVSDKRNGKYSDYDVYMMEVNAKGILTTWASRPINNYACRQFTGLMEDYYIAMWEPLLERVSTELRAGKEEIDPSFGREKCFTVGWDFAVNEKDYKDIPEPSAARLKALIPKVEAHYIK